VIMMVSPGKDWKWFKHDPFQGMVAFGGNSNVRFGSSCHKDHDPLEPLSNKSFEEGLQNPAAGQRSHQRQETSLPTSEEKENLTDRSDLFVSR
jgi:hypothetical protein